MNSVIIFCAIYLIFIIGLVGLGYWFSLPRKQKTIVAVTGAVTLIVAFLLAKIGAAMFYDARPFVSDHVTALFKYTDDNGFPSDHTLLTASIAVAVLFVSKKWGIGLLIGSIVIGTARVLANVHHPIDIIGSLVFVAVGGVVAYYLQPKLLAYLSKSRFAKPLGLKSDNDAVAID